jgi:membrane protease YdiL (CAAX protease family)
MYLPLKYYLPSLQRISKSRGDFIMSSEKMKTTRTIGPILYFPITRIVLGGAICFAMLVGVQNFITKPVFYSLMSEREIADTLINYISATVLLVTYFYLFRWYEKRTVIELDLKHAGKELVGGLLLGFFILSMTVLILYVMGHYTLSGYNASAYFLKPFSLLVVAALLEEIMFRLIIYRILEAWLGTYYALLIISVVFTLPHLFNEHVSLLSVVMLLLFGCVHGAMFTYTKRLWLPFAFHLGWNFAQPFYGSNLSGNDDMGSILKSTFEGPELFIGSKFGIEDSILSIAFLLLLCTVFLTRCMEDGKIVPRSNDSYKQTKLH